MQSDDRSTYVVLVLAGLVPLIAAFAVGGAIGSGATVCYLMVGFGTLGLTGFLGRFAHSPPEARARRARSR